jgi:DNA-binding transcriptional MerR regulator
LTKGPDAFRTISEASDELGVPQHVLRFWETRFSFIRPMKRAGGRRFYRPQDLAVLRGVRTLLHDEGYTIKGVQKLHKEQGVRRLLAAGQGGGVVEPFAEDESPTPASRLDGASLSLAERRSLAGALADLQSAKAHLDGLLQRR